jgi:endonuclease I
MTPEAFKAAFMKTPECLPYTAPASEGADVWDGVTSADASEDRTKIVLLYSRYEIPPGRRDREHSEGGWTREHVWPQSRGGLREAGGRNGMSTSSPGIGTDLHNLFAADRSVNSARQNKHFARLPGGEAVVDRTPMGGGDGALLAKTSIDAWEPPDACKGEVARAALYMACMYADRLNLVRGFGDAPGEMGDLGDLLDWNYEFPPTDRERRRNDVVEGFQGNRNPFIDDPSSAGSIEWLRSRSSVHGPEVTR